MKGPDDNDLAQKGALEPKGSIVPFRSARAAARAEAEHQPGNPPTITLSKSDVQLARHAVAVARAEVSAEGSLWRRDGAIWRRVPDGDLHAAIVGLDGMEASDDTIIMSAGRVRGLMSLATDLDAQPDFFAGAAPGVAVGEEWITVGAAGLRREPLRADHRARWRVAAEPGALDERPTRWLALLADVLADERGAPRESGADEIVTAIGETIGLALIGLGATRDARHLLLVGPPASGKSTLLAIVSSLAPPEAQTAMTLHDLAERFRGAQLVGARLVLCPEMPARDLLDVERAKAVLTGDPITVERKYRDPITIRPSAGWIVAANELPAAPDASRAIYRRWIVVELRRQYPISARDYAAEIVAAERSGIVGWALRCAAGALARGQRLVPADSSRAAEQWARDSDPVTDWLAERTTRDPDAHTSRETAWSAYRDWASRRGHKVVSLATFRRRLAAAGVRGGTDPRGGLPLCLSGEPDPLPRSP